MKIKYEVISTNGIFIRNTHSHEAKFVIIPPQKGPITPPASALAPTKPNAMGGLNLGATFDEAEIVIGIKAPAPIACINLLIIKIQ